MLFLPSKRHNIEAVALGWTQHFHVLCKRDEIYPALISITKIPLADAIRLRHLARSLAPPHHRVSSRPSRGILLPTRGENIGDGGGDGRKKWLCTMQGRGRGSERKREIIYIIIIYKMMVNIILCEYPIVLVAEYKSQRLRRFRTFNSRWGRRRRREQWRKNRYRSRDDGPSLGGNNIITNRTVSVIGRGHTMKNEIIMYYYYDKKNVLYEFRRRIFVKTQVCYINHLSRFWELIHLKHSLYVGTNNINERSK